jgi:hypothetical protein
MNNINKIIIKNNISKNNIHKIDKNDKNNNNIKIIDKNNKEYIEYKKNINIKILLNKFKKILQEKKLKLDKNIDKKSNIIKYRERRKDLIDFLNKKYKNKYIHLSNNLLNVKNIIDYKKEYNQYVLKFNDKKSNIYYNPKGIWVGCGSDWISFVDKYISPYYEYQDKISKWSKFKYVYEIKVNKISVLKIKNIKELILFQNKYAFYDKKTHNFNIKWKEVKKIYDGLIICPYLGSNIWNETNITFYLNKYAEKYIKETLKNDILKHPKLYLEWYRHWETGSGVIWSKSGIKDIILIKTYDENNK